jgi:hypothetical protein
MTLDSKNGYNSTHTHTHLFMHVKRKEIDLFPGFDTELHIIFMDLAILPIPFPNKGLKIVEL